MHIETIECFTLKAHMENPVYNSMGAIREKRTLLVHITCDNGIDGWGESWTNFPWWDSRDRLLFLKNDIVPIIAGNDPLDRENIIKKLLDKFIVIGLIWGSVGTVYQIISAIDIALWDIQGKYKGMPIWKLLGGSGRNNIIAYASGIDQTNIESKIEDLVKKGFESFKVRVGFGNEQDVKSIKAVRKIIGEKKTLMVDVNQGWSKDQALEMFKKLEPYNLGWIEEPIRTDDFRGLAELMRSSDIKIAAGENVYGTPLFEELCGLIPIIQPDIAKHGGITGIQEIQTLSRKHSCRLIPHNYGAVICLAATIQYIASLDDSVPLEFDICPNPLVEKLADAFPIINNGKVTVPQGPGLGVKLDVEKIKFYHKPLI